MITNALEGFCFTSLLMLTSYAVINDQMNKQKTSFTFVAELASQTLKSLGNFHVKKVFCELFDTFFILKFNEKLF